MRLRQKIQNILKFIIDIAMIEILNIDCMGYMRGLPDKAFDLAIVDPPYGHGNNLIRKGNTRSNMCSASKKKPYDNSQAPSTMYFEHLFRVSTNQIIFGANHFANKFFSSGPGWIVWDKETTGNFADCELAYTSFNVALKCFRFMWNGMHQGSFGGDTRKNVKRIHPTQKPVQLYSWILETFAKPGQKILDTHLGSGASAIAAHYYGCDFVGCELDEDYFHAAKLRIEQETKQIDMFKVC